jgi:hypothetical protein
MLPTAIYKYDYTGHVIFIYDKNGERKLAGITITPPGK